jgi:hypothetical protein
VQGVGRNSSQILTSLQFFGKKRMNKKKLAHPPSEADEQEVLN